MPIKPSHARDHEVREVPGRKEEWFIVFPKRPLVPGTTSSALDFSAYDLMGITQRFTSEQELLEVPLITGVASW